MMDLIKDYGLQALLAVVSSGALYYGLVTGLYSYLSYKKIQWANDGVEDFHDSPAFNGILAKWLKFLSKSKYNLLKEK